GSVHFELCRTFSGAEIPPALVPRSGLLSLPHSLSDLFAGLGSDLASVCLAVQIDIVSNLALGLEVAFTPTNLLYCFFGVFVGTFVGVLPGIGPLAAISMLFPITFHLEPTTALIMLAGIYYGTAYGGSTASILLNIPGGTSSAITCLDGYPMSKQGRGGIALFITAVGSFFGGVVGIIVLSVFTPLTAKYALT